MHSAMVYVVGVLHDTTWTVEGVYTDPREAEGMCLTASHFVGPVSLNTPLPESVHDWPDLLFPVP